MNNEPLTSEDTNETPEVVDSAIIANEYPSHFGLIIGVLIIFLALILIGIYTWSQMMTESSLTTVPTIERPTAEENNEPESTTAEAKTEVLDIVSTSDELPAIEADLNATNFGDINTDLNAINAEL